MASRRRPASASVRARHVARQSVVGLVLALVAAVLAPLAAAPASAATASPARSSAAAAADHDELRFGDDVVRPRSASGARASYAWRGSRLHVRETLPSRWDWSIRTAVAKWNDSGSRIRLVLTSDRRRAQVTLRSADTGEAAGLATVGRTRGAFVELSSRYARADSTDAHTRVEVMNVLAHELGHVLGFDHTSTACSLMGPVLDVSGCGVVADDHPGAYRCRTIDAPLATRLVRLYGGTTRLAARGWCLIDPLPGTLAGVEVELTEAGVLTVTWRPPTSALPGSAVEVTHWQGDCGAVPADAVRAVVPAGDGRWWRAAAEAGPCLAVGLVNRYGLYRTLTGARVGAGAVAVAPVAPAAP